MRFRAPGRVNLIGEHTDYNDGLCLPIALPLGTTASVTARDDDLLRVSSRQADDVFEQRLDEIGPDRVEGWAAYVAGVAWALREDGWDLPGMEIEVDGRVPLGASLSSSAALECASALAMCHAAGEDDPDRRGLVRACMRAEAEVAGAPTGGMDQTVSLLATEGHALLIDCRDWTTEQVPWRPEEAGLTLLVVDTRSHHSLNDGGYAARRRDCEQAARDLGFDSLRDAAGDDLGRIGDERVRARARHVVTEIERVRQTVTALRGGDWDEVGRLFTASHASMRDDFEISVDELDVVVEVALDHGALGARMTGGDFGGSAIALVPTERAEETRDAVLAAYEQRGWGAPGFLDAPASAGAGRA